MARECGTCTLCCKFLGIVGDELEKPAHRWCKHCAAGSGCRIYKTRPTPCKVFSCLWLVNETIDKELKPDKVGVVLQPRPDGGLSAICGPDRPMAWRHPKVLRQLKRIVAHGYQVNAVAGHRHWVITESTEWEVPSDCIVRSAHGSTCVRIPPDIARNIGLRIDGAISLLSQVGPSL